MTDYCFVSNLEYIITRERIAKTLGLTILEAEIWMMQFITNEKRYRINRDGYYVTEQGHRVIEQMLGPHGYTIIKALDAATVTNFDPK